MSCLYSIEREVDRPNENYSGQKVAFQFLKIGTPVGRGLKKEGKGVILLKVEACGGCFPLPHQTEV